MQGTRKRQSVQSVSLGIIAFALFSPATAKEILSSPTRTFQPTTSSPTETSSTSIEATNSLISTQISSPSPTPDPTPNPTPRPTQPKSSTFFNYDPYTKWGPKYWEDVKIRNNEYYDVLSDSSEDENECDGRTQSPVNIVKQRECKDDHQSLGRRGDHNFDTVGFEILPHALRANFKDYEDEEGPMMDWSNSTPHKVPAVFAEVKLPAEHLWNGKRYAGEFQITHHWDKDDGRFVILSILMDDTDNIKNRYLEEFIREWEEVAWEQRNECDRRKDSTIPQYNRLYPIRTPEQMTAIWGREGDGSEGDGDWDIYKFITTVWYCGYGGSLTVPPCYEETKWRILDLPMTMSTYQLKRLTDLITQQQDKNCVKNTVAWKGRVARPIQENRNEIFCCTEEDWDPKYKKEWRHVYWPENYEGYEWLDWSSSSSSSSSD